MFILLGHLGACLWIFLGKYDSDLPVDERQSWLYVNDFNGVDEDGNTGFESDFALYVFSLYWTFTTLTTVGYGDYYGSTTREYLVTLCFEFIGFCYNAILISIMSNVFQAEVSFQDLLNERLDGLLIWMKKIELSYKPYHMHPKLGLDIKDTVSDAFHLDHNLIVEEYGLYH